MSMTMRISIAMATFNGAKYIQEQLESLSNQTLLPVELVVCDDGSTDDTLSIVREYASSAPFPVRIYQNETNLGFADNFLHAASLCDGEWIGFCDQDDVWLPHKLATITAAIKSHSSEQLMLVAHSAHLVGHDLKPTGRKLPDYRRTRIVGRNDHYGFWVITGFACVFRREFVKDFDWKSRPRNYFPGHYWQSHDKWICMLANALGDVLYVAEPLAYYRRHDAAATGAYEKSSVKQRVDKSQQIGSRHYDFLSRVAEQSAVSLEKISTLTTRPNWPEHLREGAERFRELSHVCDLRARVYKGAGVMQRFWRLVSLFANGGYVGNRFYAFGVLSLLKDMHFCLLADTVKKSEPQ